MSARLGSELDGWTVEDYGRSRDGVPLRVFMPQRNGPVAGLLTAAQHGEEADAALLVRRLLERVPGTETRWAVIPVLNPDGLLAGTRQNAAGVDLKVVQETLGHVSSTFTRDTYTSVYPHVARDVAESTAALVSTGTGGAQPARLINLPTRGGDAAG